MSTVLRLGMLASKSVLCLTMYDPFQPRYTFHRHSWTQRLTLTAQFTYSIGGLYLHCVCDWYPFGWCPWLSTTVPQLSTVFLPTDSLSSDCQAIVPRLVHHGRWSTMVGGHLVHRSTPVLPSHHVTPVLPSHHVTPVLPSHHVTHVLPSHHVNPVFPSHNVIPPMFPSHDFLLFLSHYMTIIHDCHKLMSTCSCFYSLTCGNMTSSLDM